MVKYEPVAGLTIKEAFVRAVNLARVKKDLVEVVVNDVYMYIVPGSDLDRVIRLYHYKKDMEYKIRVGLVKGSR